MDISSLSSSKIIGFEIREPEERQDFGGHKESGSDGTLQEIADGLLLINWLSNCGVRKRPLEAILMHCEA